MFDKSAYETRHKLRILEGEAAFTLDLYGDHIAKREGYADGVDGMEAVHFYLVHKFKWLPSQVRSMSIEDIKFVLQEEMKGFVRPADARSLGGQ